MVCRLYEHGSQHCIKTFSLSVILVEVNKQQDNTVFHINHSELYHSVMFKHLVLILITSFTTSNCITQNSKDTVINVYFKTDDSFLDSSQISDLVKLSRQYSKIRKITGYADTT